MHIVVWILIGVIFSAFLSWLVVCSVKFCNFEDTATLTLQIGILNLIVMLLFLVSTVALVRQWRSRFGAQFQQEAQNKLITYLVIFCTSFFVRGTFDIFQNYNTYTNAVYTGTMLIVLYFLCEWLPICVIYIHHRQDFLHCLKTAQCRELNLCPSPNAPHKDLERWSEVTDNREEVDAFSFTRSSEPVDHSRYRESLPE